MTLRQILPAPVKLLYHQTRRLLRNRWVHRYVLAQKKGELDTPQLSITQALKPHPLLANKVHNLQLAGDKIAQIIIEPSEIFSFWHIIGRPSASNGYKKGRNIIRGEMQEDYGGGLCQLSGLLYHLSLSAGLKILERHPHSVDFYTPETRFTPLGADATVAFGYKDLLIQNNTKAPIQFKIQMAENAITGHLFSNSSIKKQEITFITQEMADFMTVTTANEQGETLNISTYQKS